MWVWWVGGMIWFLSWAYDEEGYGKLGIAALYFTVSFLYGFAAFAYQASGQ